jgi:protein-tyrosine-phosphatase
VVFVCTHNSARSQLAAALWKRRSKIPVSVGTQPPERVHPLAVAAARQHGSSLSRTRTHHVDRVLRPDDLVFAVYDSAPRRSRRRGRQPAATGIRRGVRRRDHQRFLHTSYDQFAAHSTVLNFLPPLAHVEGHTRDGKPTVVFLYVHNAGRSQMALGFLPAPRGRSRRRVVG